jgi:hypothetical protein
MTKQNDVVSFVFASPAERDAARRVHEVVAMHLTAGSLDDAMTHVVGKWCAFRLDNGVALDAMALYDSKAAAVTAAHPREKDYCYLRITPDGISPEDAWRFLRVNRHPMIDVTAPEHVHNFALLPHMSNLSRAEKRALSRRLRDGNTD